MKTMKDVFNELSVETDFKFQAYQSLKDGGNQHEIEIAYSEWQYATNQLWSFLAKGI